MTDIKIAEGTQSAIALLKYMESTICELRSRCYKLIEKNEQLLKERDEAVIKSRKADELELDLLGMTRILQAHICRVQELEGAIVSFKDLADKLDVSHDVG